MITPTHLFNVASRGAHKGTTTALVGLAHQLGAVLVVRDEREVRRIEEMGARAISVRVHESRWLGWEDRLLLDLDVLNVIARAWTDDALARDEAHQAVVRRLEERLRRAEDELADERAQLREAGAAARPLRALADKLADIYRLRVEVAGALGHAAPELWPMLAAALGLSVDDLNATMPAFGRSPALEAEAYEHLAARLLAVTARLRKMED